MIPVFLFSLPRAGSTLLQRILAGHADISTAAEPWILLPLFYARQGVGCAAEYDHGTLVDAVLEFNEGLPNGQADFDSAIRDFALGLYSKRAEGRYFLDKTPRYALIAPDIVKVFPDAKYIFLWRNPLAIIASMIETWGAGRWVIFRYYADIFTGLTRLIEARTALQGRCVDLNYETLVTEKAGQIKKVCKYLRIENEFDDFENTTIIGQMGDPGRGLKYSGLSEDSVEDWLNSVRNPLRKYWFKKYLNQIGAENLAVMGYDIEKVTAQLNAAPMSMAFFWSDVVRMVYGVFYRHFNLPMLRRKNMARKPKVALK